MTKRKTKMKNFALIGAAGYIAPRHIKAIADTGNNLMVAYDKFDSVGRLDSSFPDCMFYTENEQFDRFCSKQMRKANPLHFTSICTPKYTNEPSFRTAESIGMRFACEYPDEINGKTLVSVIPREKWLNELTENMISWAEDKLGSREYAGWCLSFIEDSLEKSNIIEIFGGDTAKESAFLYADGMRQGIPERGAFVFYNCICLGPNGPVNWGHCGISLGDGRIIHAWDAVRIDDYRDINAMTALSGDHPKYIGWVPVERVLKQKENG